MNEKLIISVGCEYGSGGPAIGKILAEDLKLQYYDRALIDKIMVETGISQSVIDLSEQGIDVKGRSNALSHTSAPSKYVNMTDRMVYIQTQIIKKLADRGSCVFIGRCSDFVLKERPECVNIFVYAPDEHRIAAVSEWTPSE